jgi:hypothetical protein
MTKQPKPIAVSEVIERLARAGVAFTEATGQLPWMEPSLTITASGKITARIWARGNQEDVIGDGLNVPDALEKLEAAVAALNKGVLE